MHACDHVTTLIIAFVTAVISRQDGTDPPQTHAGEKSALKVESCLHVYPETRDEVLGEQTLVTLVPPFGLQPP